MIELSIYKRNDTDIEMDATKQIKSNTTTNTDKSQTNVSQSNDITQSTSLSQSESLPPSNDTLPPSPTSSTSFVPSPAVTRLLSPALSSTIVSQIRLGIQYDRPSVDAPSWSSIRCPIVSPSYSIRHTRTFTEQGISTHRNLWFLPIPNDNSHPFEFEYNEYDEEEIMNCPPRINRNSKQQQAQIESK
jgi:hypothetical protein